MGDSNMRGRDSQREYETRRQLCDPPRQLTERELCLRYLGTDGGEINWDFIRAAQMSVAVISVAQLQDVLGLGSEARMNTPASAEGNWNWRYTEGALTDELAARLRDTTLIYGRLP